jgi:CHAT domain
VGAGVPHVVAVRTDAQIADRSSQLFMEQLYLALLVGKTVKEAFHRAQIAVSAAPHTHRADEKTKFLLLPEGML